MELATGGVGCGIKDGVWGGDFCGRGEGVAGKGAEAGQRAEGTRGVRGWAWWDVEDVGEERRVCRSPPLVFVTPRFRKSLFVSPPFVRVNPLP